MKRIPVNVSFLHIPPPKQSHSDFSWLGNTEGCQMKMYAKAKLLFQDVVLIALGSLDKTGKMCV